jgi:hypothetical protein
MKFSNLLLTTSFIFIISFIQPDCVSANTTVKEVLDTASLKQQIDYVIQKSTTYEQYKVIKIEWVNKLRSHILDSLNKSRKQLQLSQNAVSLGQKSIDSIKASLDLTQSQLTKITREKNSIKFLGFYISKLGYNSLMFSIFIALAVMLGIMIFLFRRSNIVAKTIRQEFEELKVEFETHRLRSREREEKMARRHLDEILKYKEKKQVQNTNQK